MRHNKLVGLLLALSLIGFGLGIVLTEPVSFGLCGSEQLFGCISPLGTIGQPLGLGSIVLAIIFLVLIFLSHPYFQAWLKYVTWFIPVAVLWIATSSDGCGGFLTLCFDKELATWWSSGIYMVLSIGVILATFIRQRKKPVR